MKQFSLLFFFSIVLISTIQGQVKTQVICSENIEDTGETWQLLSHGIHNFELDIMPIYGELFVTSSMPDSVNHLKPNLSQAYLLPLFKQFKKNGNYILPGVEEESYLILNIAFDHQKAYQLLQSALHPINDMLTYKSNGNWHHGKLQLLVKNEVLKSKINQNKVVLTSLVGELDDLDDNFEVEIMPLLEVDFSSLTSWNGIGNIPFEDYLAIKSTVAKVHEKGKKLCVSSCPKSNVAWDVLIKSEVDFISTIHAVELQKFIDNQNTME